MPHIRIQGIAQPLIKKHLDNLLQELSKCCNCDKDYFIISINNDAFIYNEYPFIEIKWFDRGSNVKQQVVNVINSYCSKWNIAELEIVFINYEKHNYFINQKSLD